MSMTTAPAPTKPPPVPKFPRPIWQGVIAVPHPLYDDAEQLAVALAKHADEAYDAAHRRGVTIDKTAAEVVADDAVLLSHPTTGAPILMPVEEAAEAGFSTANRFMRVRMTWYAPAPRKAIQAKHLHDEDVFYAMERACRAATERWATLPPIGLAKTTCQSAMLGDIEAALPDFPPKVILAKLRKMIRRGLIDGCVCGCRGDFRRISPVAHEDVTP